jgi:hypothetical protein
VSASAPTDRRSAVGQACDWAAPCILNFCMQMHTCIVKPQKVLLLCWIPLISLSRKMISSRTPIEVNFPGNHPKEPILSTTFLLPGCFANHKHELAAVGWRSRLTKKRLRGGCRATRNSSLHQNDLYARNTLSDEAIRSYNRYIFSSTSSAETRIQNLTTNTTQIIPRFQSDVIERERSRTRLWDAACSGSPTKLIEALAAGAEVNARNEKFCRWGAIHYAVHHDEPHVLSILLDAGARVDLPCNLKVRALHLAAMNGSSRAVKFLLKAGACQNPSDQFGRTPLHYAAAAGHFQVVQVLLEAGADINTQDCAAATPLAAAARYGHEQVANLLVARGADTSIEDRFGCTPAGIAVRMGHFNTAAACRSRDVGRRWPCILRGQNREYPVLPGNASAYAAIDVAEDIFWQDEIVVK